MAHIDKPAHCDSAAEVQGYQQDEHEHKRISVRYWSSARKWFCDCLDERAERRIDLIPKRRIFVAANQGDNQASRNYNYKKENYI